MKPLIELFSSGGPVMFFIAGVSLVAWYLTLRTWVSAGSLLKRVQRMSAPLRRKVSCGPQSPVYRSESLSVESTQLEVPQETLRGNRGDYRALCFGIEAQTTQLRRTLWLIGTLAALLPLLGLLGTVLGMLVSFEVIQSYGTGQPRLLAGGIGQALMTTQGGLWTAVPVLFFHHIIHSRVRFISNEMELFSHIMQAGYANAKPLLSNRRDTEPETNERMSNHTGGR